MMLAEARGRQPHLQPLLMSRDLFDAVGATSSVVEDVPAGERVPEGLTIPEQDLYRYLLGLARGRLEQEFVPREWVLAELEHWNGARAFA
jgi:hypothetical protein